MKKLVLFATFFAAIALTACSGKKEEAAPAETTVETTETVTEPAPEAAPADTTATPVETPAAQ